MRWLTLALVASLGGAGCSDPPPAPQAGPWSLTRDAVGHYCSMTVADHAGPKGQILLAPGGEAVWFSSVRDAVAFTRLPEEPRNILAFYVNDMSRADWDAPQDDSWILADDAWFVIDSERRGGMGAAEAVPFSTRSAAEAFAGAYGGRVLRLGQIPTDYVLGPVDPAPTDPGPLAAAAAAAPAAGRDVPTGSPPGLDGPPARPERLADRPVIATEAR